MTRIKEIVIYGEKHTQLSPKILQEIDPVKIMKL